MVIIPFIRKKINDKFKQQQNDIQETVVKQSDMANMDVKYNDDAIVLLYETKVHRRVVSKDGYVTDFFFNIRIPLNCRVHIPIGTISSCNVSQMSEQHDFGPLQMQTEGPIEPPFKLAVPCTDTDNSEYLRQYEMNYYDMLTN